MSFTIPNASEVLLLKYLLNHTDPGNTLVRLYKNDITPGTADTISTYTESSAAGYTLITLTGLNFTFSTLNGTSQAVYASQTFSFTTSENIYGYYLTNVDTGGPQALLAAERFSGAPVLIPSLGGQISVTPNIKLKFS